MNKGPNQPSGRHGRRRRRRGRSGHQQHRHGGQPGGGGSSRPRQPNVFTGPMDHSYRQAQGQPGNGAPPRGGFPAQFYQEPQLEPLPVRHDDVTRIFAFIEDLFFLTKIQDTAKKLNVKVEFVKADTDVLERVEQNGNEPPALIIFDLNNLNAKPLSAIPKLRAKLKKQTTSIVGFVSHVQGDLKIKALEAGCDVVMPRSAFSQNLPQLLRRHATLHDPDVE